MEWTELEPIVKVVPRVQAAVYVNKDGKPRVRLTLSETFLNETGHPSRANIQAGRDGDVAKIRLVVAKDGKFPIATLGKGGARISNIPAIAPVPDGAREVEACEIETKSATEVIVIMPLGAWEKQLEPARPAVRVAPEAPATPPAKANGHDKVDVVEYLGTKGMKVSRDKDGYRVGRDFESKASVLTIVNRYRRAAELPLLNMTDIQ